MPDNGMNSIPIPVISVPSPYRRPARPTPTGKPGCLLSSTELRRTSRGHRGGAGPRVHTAGAGRPGAPLLTPTPS